MRGLTWSLALLGGTAFVVSGCADRVVGVRVPDDPDPLVLRSDVRTPFAPARLRVHPLTSLDRDDDGQAIILLYVELLDAWDDSVKGVGLLTAEVFGADGSRQWNVDLFDMEINGPAYDPHTRTYRFVLGSLPSWIGAGTRIRVLLQTVDASGEPVELFDEIGLR